MHVVLSGFQRYFCMQYTTAVEVVVRLSGCFIRISMNNLKDIHNAIRRHTPADRVVLSGFQ